MVFSDQKFTAGSPAGLKYSILDELKPKVMEAIGLYL
jgi:hypothetical protein